MWFKNLLIYRFTKPFTMQLEDFEKQLGDDAFSPCGPHESFRLGWGKPLGKHAQQHVHVSGNNWLICLKKQERILPSTVVNEQVQEKITEIEDTQHRKVTRKERGELKDQVTQVLLPQAFTRTRTTFAYINAQEGLLVIDTASAKSGDEITSFLRKSIGSLPVRIPAVNSAPASVMTDWLAAKRDLPAGFELGGECELKSTDEEAASVKCKGMELASEEITNHIHSGMQVTRLMLDKADSCSFLIQDDLIIRRLKFADMLREQLEDIDTEDKAAEFDASFTLMTLEVSRLVPEILEAFGGEDRSAIIDESDSVAA